MQHWLTEVREFQSSLQDLYVPSMRARIDVARIGRKARQEVGDDLDLFGKEIGGSVPERCPFTLDELRSEEFDLRAAIARLGGSLPFEGRTPQ